MVLSILYIKIIYLEHKGHSNWVFRYEYFSLSSLFCHIVFGAGAFDRNDNNNNSNNNNDNGLLRSKNSNKVRFFIYNIYDLVKTTQMNSTFHAH